MLPLYYFPPISSFTLAYRFKAIRLFVPSFFKKQSFFQRTYIKTEEEKALIIPLKKASHRTPFYDLFPQNEFNWLSKHIKAIKYAYFKSAYFFYYFPDVERLLLENKNQLLISLNREIYFYLLQELELEHKLFISAEKWVLPFLPLKRNKKILWTKNMPYYQLFGDFVSELSVLDLMMHHGREARLYLKDNFIDKNFTEYEVFSAIPKKLHIIRF